ncbi:MULTISPECIES: hypothetical protein [Pseudomonas]|uniref:Large polyvalent protein-associated domain-containing protein n=1 Tax=Pseudomonas synxantha TaxID=47883 RepID=A0AAX3IDR9_9PSED|nr:MULTISPECIES: hypothetical protein [Pseudomonas]PRW70384.1 hypothetical protein C7A09_03245 [Pseudomonas fluorescens]KRP57709.1 hypothetical protein TU77_02925 [Pseudomonas synxantha]MBA6042195.1 hypothetical protein [Pseudomonas lactis]SDU56800.1 hypothetical protein SAMN05216475_4741 [Pseudomonas synxantha]VTR04740.1 Uncharacterised protein [Pseudomonas synxantha]
MKYSKEEERQAQAKRDQAVQIDEAKQIQDIDDMLVKKGVAQKLPEPIATQQGIISGGVNVKRAVPLTKLSNEEEEEQLPVDEFVSALLKIGKKYDRKVMQKKDDIHDGVDLFFIKVGQERAIDVSVKHGGDIRFNEGELNCQMNQDVVRAVAPFKFHQPDTVLEVWVDDSKKTPEAISAQEEFIKNTIGTLIESGVSLDRIILKNEQFNSILEKYKTDAQAANPEEPAVAGVNVVSQNKPVEKPGEPAAPVAESSQKVVQPKEEIPAKQNVTDTPSDQVKTRIEEIFIGEGLFRRGDTILDMFNRRAELERTEGLKIQLSSDGSTWNVTKIGDGQRIPDRKFQFDTSKMPEKDEFKRVFNSLEGKGQLAIIRSGMSLENFDKQKTNLMKSGIDLSFSDDYQDVVVSRKIGNITERETFPLSSIVVGNSKLGAGLFNALKNISSADNQYKEIRPSNAAKAANADALFEPKPVDVEERQTSRRNKPSM